jgi:hypothetical protein
MIARNGGGDGKVPSKNPDPDPALPSVKGNMHSPAVPQTLLDEKKDGQIEPAGRGESKEPSRVTVLFRSRLMR